MDFTVGDRNTYSHSSCAVRFARMHLGRIWNKRNFGDHIQMIMFMKNFAMAGGLLLLYVHGAGAFSVDARR